MKKKIAILILALSLCFGLVTKDVSAITTSTSNSETTTSSFDASKITATDSSLKNALIDTITEYLEDSDLTTDDGRKLAQLVSSIDLGHTLSASLVVDTSPEINNDALAEAISELAAGENLAFVTNVQFVVTDTADSSRSVSLSELASPVNVTITVPDQFKEALRTRNITLTRISADPDDSETIDTDSVDDAKFNTSGNIAFTTKNFAYFALSYDGDVISSLATDDTTDIAVPSTSAYTTSTTTTTTAADTSDVTIPDTAGFFGIELTVHHLLMLIAIALILIALIAYAAKRAYIRNKISWD